MTSQYEMIYRLGEESLVEGSLLNCTVSWGCKRLTPQMDQALESILILDSMAYIVEEQGDTLI